MPASAVVVVVHMGMPVALEQEFAAGQEHSRVEQLPQWHQFDTLFLIDTGVSCDCG